MARQVIPEKVIETKQRIINASIDLIISCGFSQFTLSALAQRLGITKAALYWYYSNKDELIAEITQTVKKKYIDSASAIKSSPLGAIQKLNAILFGFKDTSDSLMCILPIKIFLEYYAEDNELKEIICQCYLEYITLIGDILREGIQSGEFNPVASVDETAVFLVGAVDGLILQQAMLGDRGIKVSQQNIDIFVTTLLTRGKGLQ